MAEKKTLEECAEILGAAEEQFPSGVLWRHIKTGNLYRGLNVALSSSDASPLVLYRRADADVPFVPWARPVAEFLEKFERCE